MNAVVAAFNQEKALVGAFSVIVQPVVEPMDRFTALEEAVLLAPYTPVLLARCGSVVRPALALSPSPRLVAVPSCCKSSFND